MPQTHTWRGAELERAAGRTAERLVRFNPREGHTPPPLAGSSHTRGAAASAHSSARTVLSQPSTHRLTPASLGAAARLLLTAKRLSLANTVPGPPSGLSHTRLMPAPTAPQPPSASHKHHTDTGHRYTRISHRHHIHTRISHAHGSLTYMDFTHARISHRHGSLARADLTDSDLKDT